MREHHDDTRSSALVALERLALLGALGLIATPAVKGIAHRWRVKNPRALCDAAVDASLDDTYPASDPPAGRFVDIPENRKE